MKQNKLLIFDLDGTLVDSRQDIVKSVNLTLEHFGLQTLSELEVAQNMGNGPGWLIEQSLGEDAKQYFEDAKQYFADVYYEHIVDNTRCFDGIIEVLNFYEHYNKVILTNKAQKYADKIIKELNLTKFFKLVTGFEYFEEAKPSPLPILKILDKFEVSNNKAVMIGDSEMDILAAQKANVKSCAVTWGNRSKSFLEQLNPTYIVDTLKQMIDLF